MKNTLEILITARNLIAKRWTKHRLRAPDGSVCALGALYEAHGCVWDHEAFRVRPDGPTATRNSLDKETDLLLRFIPGYETVSSFNDHRETKKEDVLAVFDNAITAASRE